MPNTTSSMLLFSVVRASRVSVYAHRARGSGPEARDAPRVSIYARRDAATLELAGEVAAAHDGQRIHCLAVGPDGVLYTGGDDKVRGAVRVHLSKGQTDMGQDTMATGGARWLLHGCTHTRGMRSCVWPPEGPAMSPGWGSLEWGVAVARPRAHHWVWEPASPKQLGCTWSHLSMQNRTFSPYLAAIPVSAMACVWPSHPRTACHVGHAGTSCRFQRWGCAALQLIRRWKLGVLAEAAEPLYCHNYPVRALACGGGATLVSGDSGGEIGVWRI
jgi:hypothetical protein